MTMARNMYTTDPSKVAFKTMDERNEEHLVTVSVPVRPRNARERMMYLFTNVMAGEL